MKRIFLITPILWLWVCCNGQKETTQNFNPYTFEPTDTVYRGYRDIDSFVIRYVHGDSYMSTGVGRRICEVDSTVSDSLLAINPLAALINCREDTAFYNADRHYFSRVVVYMMVGDKRKQIGKEMRGYYVPHGCYEDTPECWVAAAKKEEANLKNK